eukprot:TRINITY_DN24609_c0_g1_i1.p1 TRINITY_DN24609_c0_g1~~TRINITY_DN24609_c0_g1_i1.p1  ORF type:complete len:1123 (+),score=229.05 TRINITY_DN24609_c0_g1_i1:103-3471(+)
MAAAVAVAGVAGTNVGAEVWPPATELEQWLMGAAMDFDTAATPLRRLVNANPGYGAYLASDKDIAGVVQLFAKRFRKRIQDAGGAGGLQLEVLYRPLCEVMWKSVGLVLHSLEQIDAESAERGEPAGMTAPVSREARGQLRMLLQTNEDLSIQLSDLRRAYLKELSEHRDRQRRLSLQTQTALQSLEEQPIMFYEPLNSLLDQTTKDFVRGVVEERMKLEMHGNFAHEETDKETLDNDSHHLAIKIEQLERELNKLRVGIAREAEARKRAEEKEMKSRADVEEALRRVEELNSEAEEAKEQLEKKMAEEESRRRQAIAELKTSTPRDDDRSQEVIDDLLRQVEERDGVVVSLERRLNELAQAMRAKEAELEAASSQVSGSGARRSSFRGSPASAPLPVPGETVEPEMVPEPVREEKQERVVHVTHTEEKVKVVEKIITRTDDKALEEARQELEKHLIVENGLRQANRELERALEEAEERAKKAETSVSRRNSLERPAGEQDKEVQDAISNLTKLHEKERQDQADEIERLKAQLRELGKTVDASEEGAVAKKKVKKTKVDDEQDENKIAKLKAKLDEMQTAFDDMTQERDSLEQKIEGLMAKLKDVCSPEELKETLEKIDLDPTQLKRKRKKNCFERLYDDAQRRINETRELQERLKQEQQSMIKVFASRVRDKGQLHRVSMLASLQQAAEVTNDRLQNAMQSYYVQSAPNQRMPTVSEGCESEPEAETRPNHVLADLASLLSTGCRCNRCGATVRVTSASISMNSQAGLQDGGSHTNQVCSVTGSSPTIPALHGIPNDDLQTVQFSYSQEGHCASRSSDKHQQQMPPMVGKTGPSLRERMSLWGKIVPVVGQHIGPQGGGFSQKDVPSYRVGSDAASSQASSRRGSTVVSKASAAALGGVSATTSVAAALAAAAAVSLPPGTRFIDGRGGVASNCTPAAAIDTASGSATPLSRSNSFPHGLPVPAEVLSPPHVVGRHPSMLSSGTTSASLEHRSATKFARQQASHYLAAGLSRDCADTAPCPPPIFTSAPSSYTESPVSLRNADMTRSFVSSAQRDTVKSSRSLPSLSPGGLGRETPPTQSLVNRSYELPRRPGAKGARQRMEASARCRFVSMVQGQTQDVS